jgi:hypothetical protein
VFDVEVSTLNLGVNFKLDRNYLSLRYSNGVLEGKIYARIYMDCPEGMLIDHINGNSLDNRKANLRIVTRHQNNMNRIGHSKTGLPKGVSKCGTHFRARIVVNSSHYNLGTFLTVPEAEQAYKEAALKHFGEFASHISRGK